MTKSDFAGTEATTVVREKGRLSRGLLLVLPLLAFCLSAGVGTGAACTATSGLNVINWTDGSGNWSNASNWDLSCTPNNGNPAAGDNYAVTINSGVVTLDINATVTSLTLGSAELLANAGTKLTTGTLSNSGTVYFNTGNTLTVNGLTTNNGFLDIAAGGTAQLNGDMNNSGNFYTGYSGGGGNIVNVTGTFTNSGAFYMYGTQGGGGTGDTLNVSGTFTNNAGATLYLYSNAGDVANLNALNNLGSVYIGAGDTLNITGGGPGITDVVAGSSLAVLGTTNALQNLTSVEGNLFLVNGQTTTVTPGGSPATLTLNSGSVQVAGASTLTVNGNLVNNSGSFYTGCCSYVVGGGNTVNVNGTFTNNGYLYMYGSIYGGTGDTLNVSGTFTNNSGATLYLYANTGDVVNVNALNNLGNITLGFGDTLNITGGGQGITDVAAGSTLDVGGALNVINGGTPSNGLGSLTSVEGTLTLENGQTTNTTPNGGTLTVASGGSLNLYNTNGATTLSVNGTLQDSGTVIIGTGTTLNLTQGMTDLAGSMVVEGTTNALANLTTAEGPLYLINGQTNTVTPGGSPATLTLNSGGVQVAGASTLTVNGNLVNNAYMYTGYGTYVNGGGDTVNVNGTFTNNGYLYMYGSLYGGTGDTLNVGGTFTNSSGATLYLYPNGGDVANLGALNNLGSVTIGAGDTLNITGGGQGITDVAAGSLLDVAGTLNVINGGTPSNGLGSLTSVEGTLTLENGQTTNTTPNGGTLTVASGGSLNLYNTNGATTLSVNGTLQDSGTVIIGTGTTLNLTQGMTDLAGSMVVEGTTNALANLTTAEGPLYLINGQTNTVTPGGSPATLTLNSGGVQVAGASTLTVNGNLVNNAYMYTGYGTYVNGGGDTVNVNGTFTNNGYLYMYGSLYGGTGDTLNVGGTFTNSSGATLYLYPNGGDVANLGALNNLGSVTIGAGDTLNITGGGQGITDVAAGSLLDVAGTLNVINGGTPSNGLGSLTSVEGALTLENGQTTNTTPNGGTLTVASGGGLNLYNTNGSTTLSVNGTLQDSGTVIIGTGTTLNLTQGITDLPGSMVVEGTTNALANLATVEGNLYLINGQTTTVTPGGAPATLTVNSGGLAVAGASTLTVNGNLVNNANMNTGYGTYVYGGGNTVNVNGTFTNSGSLYMYGSIYGGSGDTLNVGGTFTNNSGGTLYLYPSGGNVANVGALNNLGSVTIGAGDSVNITGAGGSSNSGIIYLYGGTLASSNGSANFNNTGTIATEGGPSAPSTLNFAGTFTNAVGGTLNLNYSGDKATMPTFGNGGTVTVASGALLGVGTGGFGAGGGLQVLANGTLNEIIKNTSASGFGVLNITGPVSLAGALNITLLNGLNPTGDTFDILNYTGSLTGAFSNGASFTADGYNWTLTYDPNQVLLSASSIPGIFTADWTSGSGHWTNSSMWSCNPSLSPCMPNNVGSTNFNVNLNSPGNTLTLDTSDTPSTINVNSLSLAAGTLSIGSGATLNLTSQPGGLVDIPNGAGLILAGTFTTGGTTSALAGLTSVEGSLYLANGQTTPVTPGGGTLTLNSGSFGIVGAGSTLTVNGNLVNNSGNLYTSYAYGGGNTVNVSGAFTNSGALYMYGSVYGGSGDTLNVGGTFTNNSGGTLYLVDNSGDMANLNALSNQGSVYVGAGDTLNITGGGQGITDVAAGSSLDVRGTLNVINGGTPSNGLGNLTSVEGALTLENGQATNTTPNGGTLTVASDGNLTLNNTYGATTLSVNGTLQDSGTVNIGTGTTLNLTQSMTDLPGTMYVSGTTNGLTKLTSVEGYLELDNAQTTSTTPNGGTLTVASTGDLRVNNGSTLSVNGNLTNSGSVYTGVGYSTGSTLNVTGTYTNNAGAQTYVGWSSLPDMVNVGALTNNGTLQINGPAALNITGAGDSSNSGTINLYGGTLASSNGGANFNNAGTITTGGSPSTLNFAGTFTNAIGGTLNLNYSGDKATMPTLGNGGTVNVASGALLGLGTGAFGAGGGLQVLGNGSLNEIIKNTAASGFGVLNITGPVSLAGALNITLLNGFNPSGDTFDILNYTGSLTGAFSNGASFSADGYNWTLTYDPNQVLLSAGAIPGLVAATWSSGTGNWTNSAEWGCSPSYSPCMPNNNGTTSFTAALDAPGQTLTLDSTSSPTSITINSVSLVAGTLDIGSGATLNLASQPGGITDIPNGAGLILAGTFTTGGSTSALAGLTSVEGSLYLVNGQTTPVTPGGGTLTLNPGSFDVVGAGSTLTVNGNLVNNSGNLYTGWSYGGGNAVNVSGTFTNNGSLNMYGSLFGGTGDTLNVGGTFTNNAGGTLDLLDNAGDIANLNAVNNQGSVYIGAGDTLNITGGGQGITDVVAGSSLAAAGTLNVINGGTPSNGLGNLTSVGGALTLENGQTTNTTPNGGTLTVASGGSLTLNNTYGATTLSVNGTLQDSGTVNIGTGTTLNLTQSMTDLPGTMIVAGTTNGLTKLTSVEGYLELDNAQTTSTTPNGGTLTVASTGDLRVNNGSTFSVNGNLTNSGIVYTGVGYSTGSTLNVTGTYTNNAGAQTYIGNSSLPDMVNVGALTNNGTLQINGPAALNITGAGGSSNSGNINLYGGTLASSNGGANFNNAGTIATGSSSTLNFAGTFTNAIGGTLNLNYSGDKATMPTLGNGGTVNVASGALLGLGTGAFGAGGGLQVLGNGSLNEIIKNTAASGFGVLNITGPVSLAGALNITLLNGFNPTGDTFDILNYTGSLTGAFSNGASFSADGYNWTLTYDPNQVLLSAGAIPGLVAATWSSGSGNWTNPAEWGCSPSYSPCMPNNNGTTSFTAALDAPGQTLTLDSTSSPTSITINSVSLVAGTLDIGSGATLNLANQPGGITDIPNGAGLILAGTFTTGGSTSALAGLTSVEGSLYLANGQTTPVTPGGGTLTLNSGSFGIVGAGSTLTVNGNLVNNSGNLYTSYAYGGGNTVNVSGAFTNSGALYMYGSVYGGSGDALNVGGTFTNNSGGTLYLVDNAGDVANLNAVNNQGSVYVGAGDTLNITGGGQGITDVAAGSSLAVAGTLNVINGGTPSNGLGNLASVEGYLELDNAQTTSTTPNGGTLTVASTGDLRVNNGSTLSVNGNLTNSGSVYTGVGYSTGSTLNVTGTYTNNAGAQTYVGWSSLPDMVNVGALTNNGTLQINGPAALNITGAGDSSNSGTINLYGGTLASSNGGANFNNAGTITTGGSPSTLNFAGTFTNAIGGTLNLNYSGDKATMPTLGNGGTVNVASGALLGLGTGAFGAGGGLQVLGNGSLNEIIKNTAASGFGVLNITGPVSLAGALNITLLNGFNPSGDTFDILNYTGSLTGAFSNGASFSADGYNWTLTYDPNQVLLSAGAIPGLVAATWSSGTGNWTNSAEWGCSPSYSPCMPNNNGTTSFTAALDAPGQTLTLDSTSSPTSITINSLSLVAGTLDIGSGATLNLASQPAGITDIPNGAGLILAGTFTTGGSTSALAGLTSVEGSLYLVNGQTTPVTPGGGTLTLNPGSFDVVGAGSTLTVNGNLVNNSGNLYTGWSYGGGNAVNVSGTFTNNGSLNMYGSLFGGTGDTLNVGGTFTNNAGGTLDLLDNAGDVANLNAVNNQGSVYVGAGDILNITGGGQGITDVVAGSSLAVSGTLNVINGGTPSNALANLGSVEGALTLVGQTLTATPGSGTFINSGALNLQHTTALTISGNLANSGSISTGNVGGDTGNNSLAVLGTLTNSGNIQLSGVGDSLSADLTNSGTIALNGNNETLTDTGDFNNNSGVLALNGNSGKVSVAGNFNNNSGAALSLGGSNGSVSVGGAFTNDATSAVSLSGSGDSLAVGGLFSNAGAVGVGGNETVTANGGFTNTGGVTVKDGILNVTSGGFNNSGGLAMTGVAGGGVSVTGGFTNNAPGTVALNGANDILTADSFTNGGAVTVGSNEKLNVTNTYTQAGGSTDVTGSLSANTYQHNGGGTTIELGGSILAPTFNVKGGGVQGNGTIVGAVAMSGGTLTPGSLTNNTPGTLSINGSFNQTGGTFEELIGRTANGLLAVSGGVTLGGTAGLQIVLGNGVVLASGESFDILNYSAGNLSGAWANAPASGFQADGFNWGINYAQGGDEVVITAENPAVTVTPEPGTWLLFGTGLLVAGGYARRKRAAVK